MEPLYVNISGASSPRYSSQTSFLQSGSVVYGHNPTRAAASWLTAVAIPTPSSGKSIAQRCPGEGAVQGWGANNILRPLFKDKRSRVEPAAMNSGEHTTAQDDLSEEEGALGPWGGVLLPASGTSLWPWWALPARGPCQ